MDLSTFSRQRFVESDAATRDALILQLQDVLARRLTGAPFHQAVGEAIASLRDCGHDLWSLDASDDMEVWGPDYMRSSGPSLFITFRDPDEVAVHWSARKAESAALGPTWGNTVRVRSAAPAGFRPGAVAEVVGVRPIQNAAQAREFGATVGTKVLLIEFGDGASVELLESWVESHYSAGNDMDRSGFTNRHFTEADVSTRARLCTELAGVLAEGLSRGTSFHDDVKDAISWLRAGGHDLLRFDLSEDDAKGWGHLEAWGPNYFEKVESGLHITFRSPHEVIVTWSARR